MQNNNSTRARALRGFSLLEVLIATVLIGAVFAMILGAVVMLDKTVANERMMPSPSALSSGTTAAAVAADLKSWGYTGMIAVDDGLPGWLQSPSRMADTKADALWRQMREIYEQSAAVAATNVYVLHDLLSDQTNPRFVGASGGGNGSGTGYLSLDQGGSPLAPLSYAQLTDPAALLNFLLNRFGPASTMKNFAYWGDANNPFPAIVDQNSYRAATVFFLAEPNDRILGILRARTWQMTSANTCPYRFYEVGLMRLRWAADNKTLSSDATGNVMEDFSYRFVEDRRFPQNLLFPPTDAQMGDLANLDSTTTVVTGPPIVPVRNLLVRLAVAGENYIPYDNAGTACSWADNVNPGVSRRQVSLAPNSLAGPTPAAPAVGYATPDLRAAVDEWHLILPDPVLAQAEQRAALRQQAGFSATLDMSFRRQGKYGCTLSVYP